MLILLSFLSKMTDKEDLPEKAKPYFRYPESDPYFGFYSEENRTMQTIGEAAIARYEGQTYDHALPQGWVDACCERGLDPRGHFVWLYDDYVGRPAPVTEEGDRICSLLARNV